MAVCNETFPDLSRYTFFTFLFLTWQLTGITRVVLAQPLMNQILRHLCNIFPNLGCSGRGRKPPIFHSSELGF